MVCREFCLFKAKQKSPHFDASKAYQGALPFDSKNLTKKYVPPVRLKQYNKLTATHSRLSQARHAN
jgi:hypothetical protein